MNLINAVNSQSQAKEVVIQLNTFWITFSLWTGKSMDQRRNPPIKMAENQNMDGPYDLSVSVVLDMNSSC
ncbi:hypothetical protein KGY79_00745 [Candidatus Bipolaricaulota bacterium]|nr:hypothetical protein [Candidatus Bipolaricaulota bacterium]